MFFIDTWKKFYYPLIFIFYFLLFEIIKRLINKLFYEINSFPILFEINISFYLFNYLSNLIIFKISNNNFLPNITVIIQELTRKTEFYRIRFEIMVKEERNRGIGDVLRHRNSKGVTYWKFYFPRQWASRTGILLFDRVLFTRNMYRGRTAGTETDHVYVVSPRLNIPRRCAFRLGFV